MLDRLLQFDDITRGSIERVIADIDAFSDSWEDRQRLSVDELRELRQLATIQSVGSSTRIEGSKLSDEAIAELIQHLAIQELESRDEQEVVGYHAVLDIILEQYEDLHLTETLVKGFHNELMRYSTKDHFHKGDYKQLCNSVVATDTDGGQPLIFNTTSPLRTPDLMRSAIDWLHESITGGEHHRLIVISVFIYEFLTIHPFQDGNGRLSRLLTTLLLLSEGYDFVQYSSLERIIEEDKAKYYKALMMCQRYRDTDQEEVGRWVYYLLKCVRELTVRLGQDEGYMIVEREVLYLNKRQRQVLEYVREEGELSVKRVDELLGDVSRNTVKYDLSKLTEAGYLKRLGRGRGTVYASNRQ